MNYQKDDIEIKDYTISSNKNSNYPKKIENIENEISINEETCSSFPNKKYEKKNKSDYTNLNYSIDNNPITDKKKKGKAKENLFSIKEENSKNKINFDSIDEENDNDSYCLFGENKIEKEENKKKKDIENETNFLIDNEKEILVIEKLKKDKEEALKNISNNEEEKITEDLKKDVRKKNNCKKSKKQYPPKKINNKDSKVTSKSKIDLHFLNKEEEEIESKDDFKSYVQKPYDEEEEYKIIYEFNKLPYKRKILNIDLGVFDDESILKCITICYFDKKELRFLMKLYFIYLSKKNELYTKKDNEKIIMNSVLTEEENKKDSKENDIDEYDLENYIKIKVILKRFRLLKGNDTIVAKETKTIKKKDELNGFEKIQFEEKEDLVNYANYHKIFYILKIQKIIISKKKLPVKKIGIQNEGNTCYMNSIIQSIYNNQFLLKNIMTIDTNSEILNKEENKKHKEIINSLQSILYKLNESKYSIKILDIFYAFDWKRIFWNSPQDAEEIYMKIYEIISSYSEDIKFNCEGILENTIEVKEINYKSSKEEKFFFLQLDIENNHSLEECLEYFFKSEELSGENKYQYIDNFGKKALYDATKFYKFKKLPNLLFIQLKRFQYDSKTFIFHKNNKGISFKEEIDLINYIDENNFNIKNKESKKNKKNKKEYILYCVLVHSGSAETGHYFCFIKDFQNNCYIKFNDTSVFLAEKKEVFNNTFGGEQIDYIIKNISTKKDNPKYEVKENKKEISKNAYIFIYVKKDKISDLLNVNDKIQNIFEAYLKKKAEGEQKDNLKKKPLYKFNGENVSKKLKNHSIINRKTIFYPKINNNLQYVHNIEKYNAKTNNGLNMKENLLDNSSLLNQLCNLNNKYAYESKKSCEKSKLRTIRKTMVFKNDSNQNISRLKEKYMQSLEYSHNILNDIETNFYLVNDISNKIKGKFFIEYNTKIKVKEVPDKIRYQMNSENIENNTKDIFEEIVKSPGYRLVLINEIGFFIKFLDDEDYDITHLLTNNNNNYITRVKHLCLYNFKNIYKDENIKNAIIINFISNNLLDSILRKKEEIYNNFNFLYINPPAFIINEEINNIEELINRIKNIYIKYFGRNAQKNIEFKIYVINNKDILNLDISKFNYIKLNQDNYILYVQPLPNQINYTNLLVGI